MRAQARGCTTRGAAKAALRRWYVAGRRLPGILAIALLAGPGCYSYSVIDPAGIEAGVDVRARITPEEAARIDELIGREDRVLAGEVVGIESSGIILEVPTVLRDDGTSSTRLHQRVTLPTSSIVELEQRRLDRLRTWSLIGGIAVVAGYVVVSQFGSPSDDPGGDKPGPDAIVVPIRIRFP